MEGPVDVRVGQQVREAAEPSFAHVPGGYAVGQVAVAVQQLF